jgi:hypothetical protein
VLASFVLGAGCGDRALRSAAAPVAIAAPASLPAQDAGIELPAGAGRGILLRDCLGCHDLGGLELFRGYYTRDDWRTLILTMASHGATINEADVETLADYLALHFGPR